MGAWIQFCGHNGMFFGEIMRVGNCVVVRSSDKKPVTPSTIKRPAIGCSFSVSDMYGGYWGQDRGVFVVPHEALTILEVEKSEAISEKRGAA